MRSAQARAYTSHPRPKLAQPEHSRDAKFLRFQLVGGSPCQPATPLGALWQAIQAWRDSSGFGRVQLVKQYFTCVEGSTFDPMQFPPVRSLQHPHAVRTNPTCWTMSYQPSILYSKQVLSCSIQW